MFADSDAVFEFRGPWGVPVQIGPTIILMVLMFVSFSGTPRDIVYDFAFLALLLLSILLHELGHAWGCLIQNVPVRRVMLHGFGGYCEHLRATTPRESELIVAMGPIVTLGLWALSGLGIWALDQMDWPYDNFYWVLLTMAWINGSLAVINLMPIAPLDGGKLFELLMLRFMRAQTASRVAGLVGMTGLVLVLPFILLGGGYFYFLLFFLPSIAVNWNKLRGLAY